MSSKFGLSSPGSLHRMFKRLNSPQTLSWILTWTYWDAWEMGSRLLPLFLHYSAGMWMLTHVWENWKVRLNILKTKCEFSLWCECRLQFFSYFRAAHIPCVIIHGIAKSAGYEVGHKDLTHLRNLWNAVFINGGWRFVFPLWACRAVKEHAPGDWTLVDSKGNS